MSRSPRTTPTTISSSWDRRSSGPRAARASSTCATARCAASTELTAEHKGRDIVATAHGGTIRAALAHAFNLHPEAAVRFEIDNVSITLIEHFEQANPEHAWRVSFVNYMPRELSFAHGGPA